MEIVAQDALPRTVHGPVIATGTVGGAPLAFSQERSSRGWEALTAFTLRSLNRGEVQDASAFAAAVQHVAFTANWMYANARDIAYFHSGRYPVRAAGTSADLVWGTGEWEWQGILPFGAPAGGRPARGPVECGGGDLTRCRTALWSALDTDYRAAQATQLPWALGNAQLWRARTITQRIWFLPIVFAPESMRWTNRPSFEQVMSFG